MSKHSEAVRCSIISVGREVSSMDASRSTDTDPAGVAATSPLPLLPSSSLTKLCVEHSCRQKDTTGCGHTTDLCCSCFDAMAEDERESGPRPVAAKVLHSHPLEAVKILRIACNLTPAVPNNTCSANKKTMNNMSCLVHLQRITCYGCSMCACTWT